MAKRVKIGIKTANDLYDFYWFASADGSGNLKHHKAFEKLQIAIRKVEELESAK